MEDLMACKAKEQQAHKAQNDALNDQEEIAQAYNTHLSSPTVTIFAEGQEVIFLCDSGTTRTTLNFKIRKGRSKYKLFMCC